MLITKNRVPILAAIFAAFVLGSFLPAQNAYAQTPLTFNSGNCFLNRQNALTDHAQAHVMAHNKVFTNAPFPSIKTLYCWNTIVGMWNQLGILFSNPNGLSPLAAIIWTLVMAIVNTLIMELVNAVCVAALGILNSAFSFIKNLLCLPLPHHFGLTLNLGSFGNSSCNGVSLMTLLNDVSSGPRPQSTGAWSLWNMQTQSGR